MDLEQFKSDIIPLRTKMISLARKLMENDTDAEDIVQETLLRLWNIRIQLNSVANPAGFAMQITKNICIDKLRIQKTNIDIDTFPIGISEETPYIHMENTDAINIIGKIIEKLPELQRQIIHMRDIEGYELEEIATITGTHVSAVTMNLSRARKKVRDQFISMNTFKMTANG